MKGVDFFVLDDVGDAQTKKHKKKRHFTFCLWPIHAFMMNSAVYKKKKLAAVNEMKWLDMDVRWTAQRPILIWGGGEIRSALALHIGKAGMSLSAGSKGLKWFFCLLLVAFISISAGELQREKRWDMTQNNSKKDG